MKNFFVKLKDLIKRNAYYIVLFLCVVAMGTLVSLSLIGEENSTPSTDTVVDTPSVDEPSLDEPTLDTPSVDEPSVDAPSDTPDLPTVITFSTPVADALVEQDYVDSAIVWQPTLSQYQTHLGIDYVASAGAIVSSAYKGEIVEVGENLLDGKYVVISHGDGLTTVYKCLASVTVEVGDEVETGGRIGTVGNTGIGEYKTGDHLHFEVMKDGTPINPYLYLTEENK